MSRRRTSRMRRRLGDVAELFGFLRRRRSLWIAILVALLLVFSLVMYLVQSAAVAPYVYPLF